MNIHLRDRSRSFSNSNDRPSTATQPCSNRACSADLSVSAMTAADNTRSMVDTPPLSVSPRADSDDADSMVGTTPRRFWVPWDRAALDFVGMSVEVHEKLAERKKLRKKDTGTETEEEAEEETEEGHGSSEVSSSMRGTSPVPQPEEDLIPLPSFRND